MSQHLSNPLFLSLDALSAFAVVGWWFDALAHPIGIISTALAGAWYAYCLFEAIEKRFKK